MKALNDRLHTEFRLVAREVTRWGMICGLTTLLIVTTGCDPCMNNPCDDGVACNGVETCTAEGGQAVCGDGAPVECDSGTFCSEPDGICVDPCADFPCDDEDPCTTDSCVTDAEGTASCDNTDEGCDDGDACTENDACDPAGEAGNCAGTPVICPEGEACDPVTGLCAGIDIGTVGALIGATGVYSGAGTCGDDDDEVTLTLDEDTLTLSGLTGNDDIPLTLTDDSTATAGNVVAFGLSGHDMTMMIDTEIISLQLVHVESSAACSSELMFAPGEPPDGYTLCGPGCISPATGGSPTSPDIWCVNQSGCTDRGDPCACHLVTRARGSGDDWDHEADPNNKRKSDLANVEYRCMCLR